MRGRATAAAAFGAIAGLLACFSLAWACQTLHPGPVVTANPTTVTPKSVVTVQGSNMNQLSMDPTVPIRVMWLDSTLNPLQQLASVPGADTFTTTITVPDAAPGDYYIGAYRGTGNAPTPAHVVIPGPSPVAPPAPSAAGGPASPTVPAGGPAAATGNPTAVSPVGTGTSSGRPASIAPSTPRALLSAAGGPTPPGGPTASTGIPAPGVDPNAATGPVPAATPAASPQARAVVRPLIAKTDGASRTTLVLAAVAGLLALVGGGTTVEILKRRRLTRGPR